MGVEAESCKFESAVRILREFVCGCVCVRAAGNPGTEEANGALEMLQEIYHIHATNISHLHTSSCPPTDIKLESRVVVKNEFPIEYNGESSPKLLEDKENDDLLEDIEYAEASTYFVDEISKSVDGANGRRSKKKRHNDNVKIIKKSNKDTVLKIKGKILKKTSRESVIGKKEHMKAEMKQVLGNTKVSLKTLRRKRNKKDLSEAAKTKLQLIKKRQERDEHNKIFGKKYTCDICKKNFLFKVFVEKHILREHGPKKEVRWECNECGKFYANKRQLERHKMIHRGEKSFQCEICGKGFDTYDIRYIHQFVHIDNTFICDYCGRIYRQRRNLIQHMKCHNGQVWKCKDCGKLFNTRRKWLYHKKNHSGNVKKKQCDICGATFAASSSIKNHMMIHLGLKPYQCTQCNMSFVKAAGLRSHEKTHNNTSRCHKCEICGKMMTSKGLAYHLMVHEGSRPYKCDKCTKAFITNFRLMKHKKIHLRLGHYKSKEEAGILPLKRISSICLPKKEEPQPSQQLPLAYASVSSTLPSQNLPHIPYPHN